MFWIGIIVGVILGAVGYGLNAIRIGAKAMNMTVEELFDCSKLMVEAGHNRESTIAVWHDGEVLETVDLEER